MSPSSSELTSTVIVPVVGPDDPAHAEVQAAPGAAGTIKMLMSPARMRHAVKGHACFLRNLIIIILMLHPGDYFYKFFQTTSLLTFCNV